VVFPEKGPALAAFVVMQRDYPLTLAAGPFAALCKKECRNSPFPDLESILNQALIVSVLIFFIHLFYQFTGEIFAGKAVLYTFLLNTVQDPAGSACLGFIVCTRKTASAGFF